MSLYELAEKHKNGIQKTTGPLARVAIAALSAKESLAEKWNRLERAHSHSSVREKSLGRVAMQFSAWESGGLSDAEYLEAGFVRRPQQGHPKSLLTSVGHQVALASGLEFDYPASVEASQVETPKPGYGNGTYMTWGNNIFLKFKLPEANTALADVFELRPALQPAVSHQELQQIAA